MSILFNKLKLLKKDPSPFDMESEKLVKNRNIYNFRRFVFSPVGSILILTFIVLFGFLSFYSLSLFKGFISKKSTDPILTNVTKQNASETNFTASEKQLDNRSAKSVNETQIALNSPEEDTLGEELDIPDAPENIIAGKPQPGKLFLPLQNATPQKIEEVRQIVYLAPSSTPLNGKTLDQSDPNHGSGNMVDADSPATGQGEAIENNAQPNTGKHDKTINNPVIAQVKDKKAMVAPYFDQDGETNVLNKSKPRIKSTSPEEIRSLQSRKLKRRRMNITSKIAILTRQIEISLQQKDFKKADELLNSFALTNSSNTAYFLKLKAFMDIKIGRLESASSLLNQVLANDPNDLEAGINMAVVQIKRDNIALAKKRLLMLKKSHPSNSRINALLDQL